MGKDFEFSVHTRIHTETLAAGLQSVMDKIENKILSDDVKRQSAELVKKYSEKYVPRGDTGALRDSATVVKFADTYAVEYFAEGEPTKTGKRRLYAKPQYHARDTNWDRATKGTYSHWNRHITANEKRAMYNELKKFILEGINNG